MTVSHHSHSGQFCCHAKGTLVDVVDEAIRQGFTTFGLSEHVPRYRACDLYPEEEHLGVEQLATTFDNYLIEAHRLRQLHEQRITLLVGLETEYINEDGLQKLEQLLKRHGDSIQYLVGSVHHCQESPIDFDKERFDTVLGTFGDASEERERFKSLFCAYFDDQHTLLRRLKPEVVGHFDLCRLYYPSIDFRDYPEVWSRIERNIRFAVGYGALFEVNASAVRKGWSTAYPGSEVFDAILSLGGRLTLSDDSHGPQAVGLHYDRAYSYLKEKEVKELWYLALAKEGEEGRSRGVVARRIEGRPWLDEWPKLLELK